jgi:TRAP-type mannitol/chloroaromatic compound transport system substrate-binding protein
MKIKIKSLNGKLPSYLTAGKVYSVLEKITIDGQVFFNIIADNRAMTSVCRHDLNGGYWEVIE